jgi:hypothetical protein
MGEAIMRAEQSTEFTVTLNEEEKGVLSRLLQRSLVGIHQQKHDSETPGHRERNQTRESIIRCIAGKVRRLRP